MGSWVSQKDKQKTTCDSIVGDLEVREARLLIADPFVDQLALLQFYFVPDLHLSQTLLFNDHCAHSFPHWSRFPPIKSPSLPVVETATSLDQDKTLSVS